jgi:DNA gyrase subunit A
VRTPVSEISIVGRNTQGVRLIRLDEGERLTGIERIETLNDDGPGTNPGTDQPISDSSPDGGTAEPPTS